MVHKEVLKANKKLKREADQEKKLWHWNMPDHLSPERAQNFAVKKSTKKSVLDSLYQKAKKRVTQMRKSPHTHSKKLKHDFEQIEHEQWLRRIYDMGWSVKHRQAGALAAQTRNEQRQIYNSSSEAMIRSAL